MSHVQGIRNPAVNRATGGTLAVAAPRPAAGRRVFVHHNNLEDFSVYHTAGFVQRWYAFTLDIAFLAPIDVFLHIPFERYLEKVHAFGSIYMYWTLWILLTLMPITLYFVAPTLIFGQTLGKRIVGLRVLRTSCNPDLGFWQVMARETLGKLLSAALVLLGFLMVKFNRRNRALHDYLAGTIVIQYKDR